MDYTNPIATPAQKFLSFGDWVTPNRGDRRGEQAKVVSLYNLASGQVARIEFQDGSQLECYAAILVHCEPPALLRVGKFSLMSLWCPHTNMPGEIEIGSDRYLYHVVDNGSPHVRKCFRFHKLTGKSDPDGHTLTIHHGGQEECTCGSHTFGTGTNEQGRCKHLLALLHLEMVEMPEIEEVEQLREGLNPFADEIAHADADHQAWVAERQNAMVNRCVAAATVPDRDEIPF
jgi:hypothetical protein